MIDGWWWVIAGLMTVSAALWAYWPALRAWWD